MKFLLSFCFLILLLTGCKDKNDAFEELAPPIVEKMTVGYGIDGGNRYSFTYNHKRQVIHIVDKDITLSPSPRPDLFTAVTRNQEGRIGKISRTHFFANVLDTSESVVTYLPNENINYVKTVRQAIRDSFQYVYGISSIHADKFRWDNSASQYVYLQRTSYEIVNGNIQSIKVLLPNAQQPVSTITYEYDQKTFPFVTDFTDAVLIGLFEGQVKNNTTKRVYTYTDSQGNPKTETLVYGYTYQDDKFPLHATITGLGYRNITYTYKK